MPAKLKNGVKGAKGGKRKGAGRKPDEYLAKAAKIGDPLAVLQFYYDVASGKELEQVVTDSGETVRVPASVKDRINAGERYLDRHPLIGPVKKSVEHSGTVTLETLICGDESE